VEATLKLSDRIDRKLIDRWIELDRDHQRTDAVVQEMSLIANAMFGPVLRELEWMSKRLEDRKTIEKAKGILMKKRRWTEMQAYRKMQSMAMDRRITMVELATEILEDKQVDL
jgi:AmiR/NasT family two-component response regulator